MTANRSLVSLQDLQAAAEAGWVGPWPCEAIPAMMMTIRAARDVLDRYSDSTPTCRGGRSICETCVGSCGFEEWRDLDALLASFDFARGK